MLEFILFSIFGGLLLGSATMVIFASQTMQGALWLVLTFISAASLWILLNAEFLGLVLILVYVGAILTLFLFIIMTLSIETPLPLSIREKVKQYGIAISTALTVLLCILYSLYQLNTALTTKPNPSTVQSITTKVGNTQLLGMELYTLYIYPFELTGILLLIAIIISISLHSVSQSKDNRSQTKSTTKQDQLKVDSKDRIRLVSGD